MKANCTTLREHLGCASTLLQSTMKQNHKYSQTGGSESSLEESYAAAKNSDVSTSSINSSCSANHALVGRSAELSVLRNSYRRIRLSGAKAEVVLIYGESGCGKSALVNHYYQKETTKLRDLWCSGKFMHGDDGTRPYGAIIDATTALCTKVQSSLYARQIRSTVCLELARGELLELCSVVPAIGFFVDWTLSTPDIGVDEANASKMLASNGFAFQRFSSLYRRFVVAVASDYHPIVMFLDDLQWADTCSRKFLESLTLDCELKNFLLIGAIRTGEATSFELSQTCKLPLTTFTLDNLKESGVNELLSIITRRSQETTSELAAVVYSKTMGNPYFVTQYIEMLYREELISLSQQTNKHQWDTEAIVSRTNVTENLANILAQKIESMPLEVQMVLVVGACLGFSFRVSLLQAIFASINSTSALEHLEDQQLKAMTNEFSIDLALYKAVEAGLIEKIADQHYKFSHDKVLESALRLLPPGQRGRKLQQKIGMTILKLSRDSKTSEDWMLYSAVELLTKDSERGDSMPTRKLAKLCLTAAKTAANQAAFATAANFADKGIALLAAEERGGEEHYKVYLELSNISAEVHYYLGDTQKCRETVACIVERARGPEDMFRAYNVFIETFGGDQDWAGATAEGCRILRQLGIRFPRRPSMLHIAARLFKAKRMLRGRRAKDLENMRPMTNTVIEEALHMASVTCIAAFNCGEENLCTLLVLESFLMTLQYGVAPDTPYALAAYGIVSSSVGELTEAYEYAEVALKMLERPEMTRSTAKVVLTIHGFLWYLRNPLRDSLEPCLDAYHVGMSAGDVAHALFCIGKRTLMSVFIGRRLTEIEQEVHKYHSVMKEYRQTTAMREVQPYGQVVLNLLGKNDRPLELVGTMMKEIDRNHHHSASKATLKRDPCEDLLGAHAHCARMILLCVMNEFDLADVERNAYIPSVHTQLPVWILSFVTSFFDTFTCLAMARKGAKVGMYLRLARKHGKHLAKFAKVGCVTCVPILALFEAEKYAVVNKWEQAVAAYKESIESATSGGLNLLRAIALERMGQYQLQCGLAKDGKDYLRQAWEEYGAMEAMAKQRQMEHEYKRVLVLNKVCNGSTRLPSKAAPAPEQFRLHDARLLHT